VGSVTSKKLGMILLPTLPVNRWDMMESTKHLVRVCMIGTRLS